MQFEWLDSFYILMSCVIFTRPWLLRKTTRVTILSNTKNSFIWNCDQFKGGIMRMMINFCQHQQIGSQASSRPFFAKRFFVIIIKNLTLCFDSMILLHIYTKETKRFLTWTWIHNVLDQDSKAHGKISHCDKLWKTSGI